MSFSDFWRQLTGRRRMSFYDSQHVMRQAIANVGPIDLTCLSDDALRRIIEEEPASVRVEAARQQLAWRAGGQTVSPAAQTASPATMRTAS